MKPESDDPLMKVSNERKAHIKALVEQVRDLIEMINEEQGNGAVLRATVAA